jgi:CHRD domain
VNRRRLQWTLAVATVGVLGVGTVAIARDGRTKLDVELSGYQEVPALSSNGFGTFEVRLNHDRDALSYELTFSDLATNVTQAHIHFENVTNSGPVVVFLCSNLGNGPAGTQACPVDGGTITGTITAADVLGGAAGQGLAPGEFDELVAAIDAGSTYVNVHSTQFPAGEIRAQLVDDGDD